MIEINSVEISSPSDYSQLITEKLVNEEYIDNGVVEFLERYVGTKCKVLDIEYPYYDNDYLSSYYALYAKKHKSYSKKCYRLVFFSDAEKNDMIGYMTLRPTYHGTHICKTMFEPHLFLSENASLILSKEKVHYMGGECSFTVFPQMGQEGAVSACAHVSVWSILRSFSNRFQNYGAFRIADIANKTVQFDRKTIPTDGLTINQISNLFTQVGFSPVILRRENDNFDDEIISYLESGIPLVGVISERNHAVAMIGVCERSKTTLPESYMQKIVSSDSKTYEIALHSKYISGIFVNDDHSFPYAMVKKFPAGDDTTNAVVPYVMRDIDYIVVPFHHRVYMHYREVYAFFQNFFKKNAERLNWDPKMVVRIFLVSSNRYKEYICNEESKIENVISDVILSMETPKFMWCFEITRQDKSDVDEVDHIMLIDSTASFIEGDPILFLSGADFVEYRDGDTYEHIDINLSEGIKAKSFDNLLEKVEYKDEQD